MGARREGNKGLTAENAESAEESRDPRLRRDRSRVIADTGVI